MLQKYDKISYIEKYKESHPNTFKSFDSSKFIYKNNSNKSLEKLVIQNTKTIIAGRIMVKRLMGKNMFCHIQDHSGLIQLFFQEHLSKNNLYNNYKIWNIGDIIGLGGLIFKTQTGELTIKVYFSELLVKSLYQFPDSWYGIKHKETRYRYRYLDLIINYDVKSLFDKRINIIQSIRRFLLLNHYSEVETPIIQAFLGGGDAKVFKTYHNFLSSQFYLRVAPEIYLKKIIIGGFNKIFEINKSFRNEGLSFIHNPEFTMLEFYQIYFNYYELMKLTEKLIKCIVFFVKKKLILKYKIYILNFKKTFNKITFKDSIIKYNKIPIKYFDNINFIRLILKKYKIQFSANDNILDLRIKLFETNVEKNLVQPTFITEHPTNISILAKYNKNNKEIADRFELYISGIEISNGFSELNCPNEQKKRFINKTNNNLTDGDESYIRALICGLPPTAGAGIGIDRLVMICTNSISIRDIILFPQMKNKQ